MPVRNWKASAVRTATEEGGQITGNPLIPTQSAFHLAFGAVPNIAKSPRNAVRICCRHAILSKVISGLPINRSEPWKPAVNEHFIPVRLGK